MKRLLIILILFISIGAQGQSIIDHLGKIRMRYNNAGSNDTLLIQFSGDSTYYFSNTNRFHKFKSGLVADSLKLNGGGGWIKTLIPSQWTTSGSNIYYNTGNVGINNASPSYKLDVGGLIGGTNLETNTTSKTTKFGYLAGNTENETAERANVFVGYTAGNALTTGTNNTFLGFESGKVTTTGTYNTFAGWGSGKANTTGAFNVFIGEEAGASNTTAQLNTFVGAVAGKSNTTGASNSFFGDEAGYSNVTGNYNTILGTKAGFSSTGSSNVFLGYFAGYDETGSNKLIIDNQDRTSEALGRTRSLIYGEFSSDTTAQKVNVNGTLYSYGTFAEMFYSSTTTITQSITNGSKVKVTVFNTVGQKNDCSTDLSQDEILITKKGRYKVTLSLSYASGTNNVTWTAYVFQNDNEVENIHSTGNTANANTMRSTSLSGIINVDTVPCSVDYRVSHDYGSAVDLIFRYCHIMVEYLGEAVVSAD